MPHVLVGDPKLDLDGDDGTLLIQRARQKGHIVIYAGLPGGSVINPNSIILPDPKSHELNKALIKCGHPSERARILAERSDGNLSSLLRIIQNLSTVPEWAQVSEASDLAIASMLGSWSEKSESDRKAAEMLSGKQYGAWIATMRDTLLVTDTPLISRNGLWKVIVRYEAWGALGSRLHDEHLDRFKTLALEVLGQIDPAFELPKEERYAAQIHGKTLSFSPQIRKGMAETLALLGNFSSALAACSAGYPESVCRLIVRELLSNAPSLRWGSLDHLLPLLAEASPEEFLRALEHSLQSSEDTFQDLFKEESSDFGGRTYTSGLLWALETLAWSSQYLPRVVLCLGQLDKLDPGGNWANRPSNSLRTILLPWHPQTSADTRTRGRAVESLIREVPESGWRLLLSLLPAHHSTTSGTRRPTWRELAPEDWEETVTNGECSEQIELYAQLASKLAKSDALKLLEIIQHIDSLPPEAQNEIIRHLDSEAIESMPEHGRERIWNQLAKVVSRHKKFSTADWAMPSSLVNELSEIADRIAPESPMYRHQRLFTDNDLDLYEEAKNYEEEERKLQERRMEAVREIFAHNETEGLLQFTESVRSPWRVGYAAGRALPNSLDSAILPNLLVSDNRALTTFAGGFVLGRFRKSSWEWVDARIANSWTSDQAAKFLAYLPFVNDTWERASANLGDDVGQYWRIANVNPYDADAGLEKAIDNLTEFGRPFAAITCVEKHYRDSKELDRKRAISVLLSAAHSTESVGQMDGYHVGVVIQALQSDLVNDAEELFKIEWAFLPILGRHNEVRPVYLETFLASDPQFFCELIRLVFHPKKQLEETKRTLDAAEKSAAEKAYRLLNDWRVPPGSKPEGTFDGAALQVWVKTMKDQCAQDDRLEIGLMMFGAVLRHAPEDPSGLWIHKAAASVLDSPDAEAMRNGFRTALFNSRGTYSPTGGREEREIAAGYRRNADAVESEGYHRLAGCLREVAAAYDRDAKRAETDDIEDD
ncbi:MAG: hypothetical protein WD044_13760 [Dongiaceae bacterium]